MRNSKRSAFGFTLLEMVITLVLIVIITGFSMLCLASPIRDLFGFYTQMHWVNRAENAIFQVERVMANLSAKECKVESDGLKFHAQGEAPITYWCDRNNAQLLALKSDVPSPAFQVVATAVTDCRFTLLESAKNQDKALKFEIAVGVGGQSPVKLTRYFYIPYEL